MSFLCSTCPCSQCLSVDGGSLEKLGTQKAIHSHVGGAELESHSAHSILKFPFLLVPSGAESKADVREHTESKALDLNGLGFCSAV